jgi:Tol biopolymer transport system component
MKHSISLWLVAVAAGLVLPATATAQVTAVNGRIAYNVCEYNSTIGFTTCDIWTVNPDGSGQTNLTNTPDVNEFGPAWSADGTRIAFVEGFNGVNRVLAMNGDGTNVVPILDTPSFQFDPSWSPDGTQIAFVRQVPGIVMGLQFDIFVVNTDGTGEVNITSSDFDELFPAWSPDGTKIAFSGVRFEQRTDPDTGTTETSAGYEIVTVNPDGSGEQIVSAGDPGTPRAQSLEQDWRPAWSPDSSALVFSSQNVDPCCTPWQIWYVRRDGTGITLLSPDPAFNDGDPSFSPDGTLILFSSDRDGASDLYTIPAPTLNGPAALAADALLAAATTQVTRLTAQGNVSDPSWGRDPGTTPAQATLTVSLQLQPRAGGLVASLPLGIFCGRDCTETYKTGTVVRLLVVPKIGSRFAGWTGACTGSKLLCIVTMNASKNVGAKFVRAR